MEEPGPEVETVIWKHEKAPVFKGQRRPEQLVVSGPEVMMIRCAKCKREPWRATEGPDTTDERFFQVQRGTVSFYCGTCQQRRAGSFAALPGFVEAHS